jgi:hypothetical protein
MEEKDQLSIKCELNTVKYYLGKKRNEGRNRQNWKYVLLNNS